MIRREFIKFLSAVIAFPIVNESVNTVKSVDDKKLKTIEPAKKFTHTTYGRSINVTGKTKGVINTGDFVTIKDGYITAVKKDTDVLYGISLGKDVVQVNGKYKLHLIGD